MRKDYFMKFRMVFVDFDDTLCIHRHDKEYYPSDTTFAIRCILGTQNFCDSIPNKKLGQLLKEIADKGIKVYGLGWTTNNLHSEVKQQYIDVHFPDTFQKFIGAGTREGKLDVINSFASAYGISSDQILLIDDHPSTLMEVREAGYYAMTPIEIMLMDN